MHGKRRNGFPNSSFVSRGYEESMDTELQELFNFAIKKGVTLFDTADSYGGLFCSSTRLTLVQHRLTIDLPACIRRTDTNICSGPNHQIYAGTGRLNGRSEQLLGKFIAESPAGRKTRDGILVATKLAAYPWRLTPSQFVQACRSVSVLATLRCESCPACMASFYELPRVRHLACDCMARYAHEQGHHSPVHVSSSRRA